MLKNYFQLQFTIIKRKLIEFGLNPYLALILIPSLFIFFSLFLFSKTEFAQYIYIFIALGFINRLSEVNRNDFLKSIFSHHNFIKVRVIENYAIAFTFILFLLYEQEYYGAILLAVIASFMAVINSKQSLNIVIPTPFFRKPFEFIIGFRNSFYLFFIAYFLTLMAVLYNNFNLGIFSILLIFLITLGFYSKPENEFFVWSFSKKPSHFLYYKIKISVIQSSILILPIAIALYTFFGNQALLITATLGIGYIYLATIILSKYSFYPNEFSLPQALLIVASIMFAPLLLIIIPYLYFKSIKQLNNYIK